MLRPEVVASDALQEIRRLVPVLEAEHRVEVRARPGVAQALLRLLETEGIQDGRVDAGRIRVTEDESAPADSFEIHAI